MTYGLDLDTALPSIGLARAPQVLRLIHEAGATAVRTGGDWATEERQPGKFDFTQVDQVLGLAKSNVLTVLFELGREPSWDASGGDTSAPPADCASPTATCASVSAYVTALVRHAAPEGLHYLIVRNEPQDFNKNWVGGSAATYAHFQHVVYEAAHAAEPGIEVLNGGTEATSPELLRDLPTQANLDAKAIAFSKSLYDNPEWCDSLDVLDLHLGDFGPQWSPKIIDASERAVRECNGGKKVPVWVTEVGYPSTPSLQASSVYEKELEGKYQGGEAGQAKFLTDTFAAIRQDGNAVGIDWTFPVDPNLVQTPPTRSGAAQTFDNGFGDGLVYASYKEKASYRAYQQVASSAARRP